MTNETNGFSTGRFDNSYARLPEQFYARLAPVPVKAPSLIRVNETLAGELGLDGSMLTNEQTVAIFSGNHVPEQADPIAMAYAGHQFGHFVPQLGDGRAILLGELIDTHGAPKDIHLKGSGQTPFSRQGDGRAAIGPVLREYIVSEAMHALGIPTTRSLAAVATGEPVSRERLLPGAVLTRVAASHVRVGTFEYFAARGDNDSVKTLADYVINRLYPSAKEAENPYLALLEMVMEKQARLIASWMHVGFIHGVMNTDNMAISGETIDYGPCAFMDSYDPNTVFSSIDITGRYAYGNQGHIAQWNLARFAETLLFLYDENSQKAIDKAEAAIVTFPERFQRAWLDGMRRKLGLVEAGADDNALVDSLLDIMHQEEADFTLTFRALCRAETDDSDVQAILGANEALPQWLARWKARLAQEASTAVERDERMRMTNPAYIPRNHQIAKAIAQAEEQQGYGKMETLMAVLAKPYEERQAYAEYRLPPKPDERVYQTFCGT